MPRLYSPRVAARDDGVGVGGGEAEVLRRIAGRLAGLTERIDEAGGRAWEAAPTPPPTGASA